MPFKARYDPVFSNVYRSLCADFRYDCLRADSIRNSRAIFADIVDGILGADLILADLSGANPNVFYELGLAHAAGRNVFMTAERATFSRQLPFDIRTYRVVMYENSDAGLIKLKTELRSYFSALASAKLKASNPYADANKSVIIDRGVGQYSDGTFRTLLEKLSDNLEAVWKVQDAQLSPLFQKARRCRTRQAFRAFVQKAYAELEDPLLSESKNKEQLPWDITLTAVDDAGTFVFHPSKQGEVVEPGHPFYYLIGKESGNLYWLNRYSSERFDELKTHIDRRHLRLTRLHSRRHPLLGYTFIIETHVNLTPTLPRQSDRNLHV